MDCASAHSRKIAWAAVVGLAILHFAWLASYHVPAISTPDANSYFAQARRIAREGTTSFPLESPAQFVAPHWNEGTNGRYYCTHPPGLGVILAIPYILLGYSAATWVNLLLASMSLIVVFLLCRKFTGPNWALLATSLVALNLFANEHALFGDSHVAVQFVLLSALLCLFQMTRKDSSIAWGLAAGLLAGTIPTLRYPELLYLPALGLFVVIMACRRRVTVRSVMAFAFGVAVPLALLFGRNQIAYGGFWRTGYVATGEQAAFSVTALVQHAPTYLWKLLAEGAGLMFPLGVAGIAALLIDRKTRHYGLLLAGLIAPVTLLYMAWYWRPDPQSMRFLIPVFPLYTITGVWMMKRLIRKPHVALWVSAGILAVTAAWGVPRAVMGMRHLERNNRVLAEITEVLEQQVPPGSVVIAGIGVQQHLDFVGCWKLADAGLVNARPSDAAQEKGPGTLASGRSHLHELPTEARLDEFIDAVWEWAGDGSRVFLLAKPAEAFQWEQRIHIEQLHTISLPTGQTPRRARIDKRERADALPVPDPNSIFDLSLDGQVLVLYELER
jgi:4-amino-4-deoxy-L-arabinose transferase-like glycosyltransferase